MGNKINNEIRKEVVGEMIKNQERRIIDDLLAFYRRAELRDEERLEFLIEEIAYLEKLNNEYDDIVDRIEVCFWLNKLNKNSWHYGIDVITCKYGKYLENIFTCYM